MKINKNIILLDNKLDYILINNYQYINTNVLYVISLYSWHNKCDISIGQKINYSNTFHFVILLYTFKFPTQVFIIIIILSIPIKGQLRCPVVKLSEAMTNNDLAM